MHDEFLPDEYFICLLDDREPEVIDQEMQNLSFKFDVEWACESSPVFL